MTGRGFAALGTAPQLQKLIIQSCRASSVTSDTVSALARSTSLKHLYLGGYSSIEYYSDSNSATTALSLSERTLCDLSRLRGLETLDFIASTNARVTETVLLALAGLPRLRTLILSEHEFVFMTDTAAIALSRTPRLECLHFYMRPHGGVTHVGIHALVQSKTLHTLMLMGSSHHFSRGICHELAAARYLQALGVLSTCIPTDIDIEESEYEQIACLRAEYVTRCAARTLIVPDT